MERMTPFTIPTNGSSRPKSEVKVIIPFGFTFGFTYSLVLLFWLLLFRDNYLDLT